MNSPLGLQQINDRVSLSDYLDVGRDNLALLLGIFGAVVLAGLMYAFGAFPRFEADALVQVEEKKGTSIAGLQEIASALNVGESPTAGEIEILRSREVIGKAIDALKLTVRASVNHRVPYFYPKYNIANDWHATELAKPLVGFGSAAWGGEYIRVTVFEIPHQFFEKKFQVVVKEGGRWTLLSPSGRTVADGKVGELSEFQLSGETSQVLIGSMLARPGESFTLMRSGYYETYKRLLDDLKIAEAGRQSAVIKISFDAASPYDAASVVNEITKAYLSQNVARRSEEAEKSLSFLEQQLPELKAAVEKAEEAFNQYRLSKHSVDLDKEADALLTQSVDLEKQSVEAELQRQNLAQRFQPNHPELLAVQNEVGALNGERAKLADQIRKLPETEQEALRLQRDVKVNTDLYISLLNNVQQLKVAKAGTIGNANVIDFAIPEEVPVFPQKFLVISFSVILGIFLSATVVVVRDGLKSTLDDSSELDRMTGIPTYATILESKTEEKFAKSREADRRAPPPTSLLYLTDAEDPAIEALRGMRLGLQFAIVGGAKQVICISGAVQSQGKTFVASNLAAVLAEAGKRVLLIDADLRRPRISESFGLARSPGLSELLSGKIPLSEVIYASSVEGLSLIRSGQIPPNPSELLTSATFAEVIDRVAREFDYTILDTPPILPVGDTLSIAQHAAAVFLVMRAGSSRIEEFYESQKKLQTVQVPIKGIIFNGVKVRRKGVHYRYKYVYDRR